MKRILYVTTVSQTVNAFLLPHIELLLQKGYSVDVAYRIESPPSSELERLGVTIHPIPFSRNPLDVQNVRAYHEIKKLIERKRYDAVHVHTPVAAFVTRMAIRHLSVKKIYTAHGFHFYKGAPFINWALYYSLEKVAARWTDAIITMNEEDYTLAKKQLRSPRVFHINGIGVDLAKYEGNQTKEEMIALRQSLGLHEEDFVITVIAELIKRKNHLQIIEAMKELRNNYPTMKVLFVGKGKLKEHIQQHIQRAGLEQNILMLGYRTDIRNLIQISDVIALFSYQEGLPRNLMEGMVNKKTIVCTAIRGNSDLVAHDHNGFLVPIDNVQKTKEALETLYHDKERRIRFGLNSKKKVEKYEIHQVLQEMDQIYEAVLS